MGDEGVKPLKYANKSASYQGRNEQQKVAGLIEKTQLEYKKYLRKSAKKNLSKLVGSYVVINSMLALWLNFSGHDVTEYATGFSLLSGAWLIWICALCLYWLGKRPITNTGKH